jgi:hypothetical protein
MTTKEAAVKLLEKMGTQAFQWKSVMHVGHLLTMIQTRLNTTHPDEAIYVLKILLRTLVFGDYHSSYDFSQKKISITLNSTPIHQICAKGSPTHYSIEDIQHCFSVVLSSCHYYSLCCNNLSDHELWKAYDNHQFEQFNTDTPDQHLG